MLSSRRSFARKNSILMSLPMCVPFQIDRQRKANTHQEKDITDTFTLMDLDGKTGRQYHIGYFFSAQAPRGSLKESWPENPEQNMERLQNAGFPVDSMIPKCSNCDGKLSSSSPITTLIYPFRTRSYLEELQGREA